eukprot:61505_1
MSNRDEMFVFPAPMVERHPLENAFIVSHVPFEELEVVAPTLKYQILEAGPMKYHVAYQPTGKHYVKLKVAGKVISRFTVTKAETANLAGIRPALLEATQVTLRGVASAVRQKILETSGCNLSAVTSVLDEVDGLIADGTDLDEAERKLGLLMFNLKRLVELEIFARMKVFEDSMTRGSRELNAELVKFMPELRAIDKWFTDQMEKLEE